MAGTEPTLEDTIWQTFEVDTETGKLASPLTPAERVESRVYQILPQEAADWVRENGIEQPPRGGDGRGAAGLRSGRGHHPALARRLHRGQVQIIGNARGGPYRLDYGYGTDPTEWIPIGDERSGDVENGPLGEFDTKDLAEGPITLRLTVNRGDGVREWKTPVTIDNTPPTVVVSEPKPDQLYVVEDDEQININVLVNDTWAVDRVEYVIDSSSFATRTVAPYNERWPIVMRNVGQVEAPGTENWLGFESDDPDIQPGRARPFADGFWLCAPATASTLEGHLIKVIAYDRAGNKTESDEVRVYVRARPEKNE